jgi:Flp pilus assembly protein TadG
LDAFRKVIRQRSHVGSEDQGSAAVEFVLVLPVLLLILFAIVDFGRMLNAKIVLSEAAREGARAVALAGPGAADQRVNAVVSDLSGDIDRPYRIDQCDPSDPTSDATVTLTYHFEFVTPLAVLAGFGDSDHRIALTATGVMPCL